MKRIRMGFNGEVREMTDLAFQCLLNDIRQFNENTVQRSLAVRGRKRDYKHKPSGLQVSMERKNKS